jgi:RNA polymerase sigma factor (sigma-70 family)
MQRVYAREPEAFEQFILEFTPALKRWVRDDLRWYRVQPDQWWSAPSDFVQVVWVAFFKRRFASHPCESIHWVREYMRGMARNVVRDAVRHHLETARRDAVEVALEEALQAGDPALLARVAGPPESLTVKELWELMLKQVRPGRDAILQLLRDGHSVPEVARQSRLSEKTIRRLLQRMHETIDSCSPLPADGSACAGFAPV